MDKKTTKNKPVCIISNMKDKEVIVAKIKKFIVENEIKVLNVCGHRQKTIKEFDIQKFVKEIMVLVLK